MNDEKKKLAIVVVLVSVMACVGVFQVLGKRKSSAPPLAPLKVAVVADNTAGATAAKTVAAPDAANPAGASLAGAAPAAAPKNPEVATPLPPRDPFQAPAGMVPAQNGSRIFGKPKPFRPAKRGFGFGPMPPNFGAGARLGLKPIDDKPFGWSCVGVIGGDNPAALFEDGAGNQKVVTMGSAIDPDSRLKGIEDDAVSVEFRGKRLRLTVGGNPVGK